MPRDTSDPIMLPDWDSTNTSSGLEVRLGEDRVSGQPQIPAQVHEAEAARSEHSHPAGAGGA